MQRFNYMHTLRLNQAKYKVWHKAALKPYYFPKNIEASRPSPVKNSPKSKLELKIININYSYFFRIINM